MKSFTFYITETFDKPYPWKWVSDRDNYKKAESLIPTGTKSVLPTGSILKVEFSLTDLPDDTFWDIQFLVNYSMGITGDGDAMKIFATVLDVIKKFVEKNKPKKMKFSAEKIVRHPVDSEPNAGSSRISLYNRLVQRFASSAGYSSTIVNTNWKTDYTLMRK